MFNAMIVQGADHHTINLRDMGASVVETEFGYIMGVDIPTKIADAEEARLASQAVTPAIDAPIQFAAHVEGNYSAADFVADYGALVKVVFEVKQLDPTTQSNRSGRCIRLLFSFAPRPITSALACSLNRLCSLDTSVSD